MLVNVCHTIGKLACFFVFFPFRVTFCLRASRVCAPRSADPLSAVAHVWTRESPENRFDGREACARILCDQGLVSWVNLNKEMGKKRNAQLSALDTVTISLCSNGALLGVFHGPREGKQIVPALSEAPFVTKPVHCRHRPTTAGSRVTAERRNTAEGGRFQPFSRSNDLQLVSFSIVAAVRYVQEPAYIR